MIIIATITITIRVPSAHLYFPGGDDHPDKQTTTTLFITTTIIINTVLTKNIIGSPSSYVQRNLSSTDVGPMSLQIININNIYNDI